MFPTSADQNGELQGQVDFDCGCCGDPLSWLALTAVGIVSDLGTRELFEVEELKRLETLYCGRIRARSVSAACLSLRMRVASCVISSSAHGARA